VGTADVNTYTANHPARYRNQPCPTRLCRIVAYCLHALKLDALQRLSAIFTTIDNEEVAVLLHSIPGYAPPVRITEWGPGIMAPQRRTLTSLKNKDIRSQICPETACRR